MKQTQKTYISASLVSKKEVFSDRLLNEDGGPLKCEFMDFRDIFIDRPVHWYNRLGKTSPVTKSILSTPETCAKVAFSENNVILEGWDKGKKFVAVQLNEYVLDSICSDIGDIHDYVFEDDGEAVSEEYCIAGTSSPNFGKGLYFKIEGNVVYLNASFNGTDTVLEKFDNGDKLTTFKHTLSSAIEEALAA